MSSAAQNCPRCKTTLKLPGDRPKSVKCKCPKCGAEFQVPSTVTSPPETVMETPKKKLPPPVPTSTKSTPPPVNEKRPSLSQKARDNDKQKSGGGGSGCVVGIVLICVGACLCLPLGGLGGFFLLDGNPGGLDKWFAQKDRADKVPGDDPKDRPADAEPKDRPPLPDGKPPDPIEPERTHSIPFAAIAPRQRLEQVKVVQIKGRVTFAAAANANDVVVTWESLRRLKYDEQIGGAKSIILLVGSHGWMTMGPKVITLQNDGLAFYQNFNYGTTLSNLIPLLEEGFTMDKAPPANVRGKSCYSMIVKRAGRPNLNMFFEKDTDLLYKVEFRGRFVDSGLNFMPKETFVEFFFTDYQVIDGIKHWRRQEQWRDGKRYSELVLSDVRFLAKPDDALFAVDGLDAEIRTAMQGEKREQLKRMTESLKPGPGSDFTRLVRGLTDEPAGMRPSIMKALATYTELASTNEAPPLARADVTSLVALLRPGTDPELQLFAIEAVAKLGPQATEAIKPLSAIAQTSRDAKVLSATLTALKNVGPNPEAVAAFERHINHADPGVRNQATLGMLELAPDKMSLNTIQDLMARPDEAIKAVAGKLLRQRLLVATKKDMPALREALKRPGKEIQMTYLEAIGFMKADAQEAAPEIAALAASTDKEVAAMAMRTLDDIGMLPAMTRDSVDAKFVLPALTALKAKARKSDDAIAAYEKHLEHPDNGVKNLAARAMIDLAPERLPINRLVELMARPVDDIRMPAGKLLRERLTLVTAKDLPALREGLNNPTREVRIAFIEAVGSLKADGAEAAPELGNLLAFADKEIVLAAIQALENLGKGGEKAVPALAKAVESTEKTVALAATLALCKIDPNNATMRGRGIEVLVEGLEPDLKDHVAFSKAPLGTNKSVALLLDIGEPAVAGIVKTLLTKYTPKTLENRRLEATAHRLMGYELLKELANRAKTKDDKKLSAALKKHELGLKAFWEPQESCVAKDAAKTPGMPADTKKIYTQTAEASFQAYRAISALK